MANTNLGAARVAKNDEFYTTKQAIEAELGANLSYRKSFEGKTVLMNCDDPEWSEFWKFFTRYFHVFKLKKIISTHFNMDGSPSYKLEWDGTMDSGNAVNMIKTPLEGNGDFASPECVALLDESDIVVTNPPFSKFRDYLKLLIDHNKQFAIIGSMNAITYKEVFPLLKGDKVWLGYTSPKEFKQPDGTMKKFGNIMWYTNIDIAKRHEELELFSRYYPEDYPKYDNYDAIEVGKVSEIPCDYTGVMGVPITFLDKYCPEQFEIISIACGNSWANYTETLKSLNFNPKVKYGGGLGSGVINGKGVYARLLIKRKEKKTDED